MKAKTFDILKLLNKSDKFSIPIYQRKYAWDKEQCEYLWMDILNLLKHRTQNHFLGSVVAVSEDNFDEYQIIDGQQRITTLTIIISVLLFYIEHKLLALPDKTDDSALLDLRSKLTDLIYVTDIESDTKTPKLQLTDKDQPALEYLLSDQHKNLKTLKQLDSSLYNDSQILENAKFFWDKIDQAYTSNQLTFTFKDIGQIFKSLQFAFIQLNDDNDDDDPQVIFETLNSTGLALAQSDLIRNYLLMNIPLHEEQEKAFKDYWQPLEVFFANSDKEYDKKHKEVAIELFFQDLMFAETGEMHNKDQIYNNFKKWFTNRNKCDDTVAPTEKVLESLQYIYKAGVIWAQMFWCTEFSVLPDNKFSAIFDNRNKNKSDKHLYIALENRLNPQLLTACESLVKQGQGTEGLRGICYLMLLQLDLSNQDDVAKVIQAIQLLSSYALRINVCTQNANRMNSFSEGLIKRITDNEGDSEKLIKTLRDYLVAQKKTMVVPDDEAFKQTLIASPFNVKTRQALIRYILLQIERYQNKEPIRFTDSALIDAVLPISGTADIDPSWRSMLGAELTNIQTNDASRLGNITLVLSPQQTKKKVSNLPYAKESFAAKKANYATCYRRHLNSDFADPQTTPNTWSAEQINERGKRLAEIALKVWPDPIADLRNQLL